MTSSLSTAMLKWKEPSAEFRLAPFFILNDDLETDFARNRVSQMLEQCKEVGYGGAYFHPRTGLITEYKSAAWFEFIEYCIGECERLGLEAHLYDENTYPSGFAGGHVTAEHPEARARFVSYEILTSPPPHQDHFTTCVGPTDVFLAAYELNAAGGVPTRCLSDEEFGFWLQDRHPAALPDAASAKDATPANPVLLFYIKDMRPTPWHGELPYVSLVDPAVAPSFLRQTHEEYYSKMKEKFGISIRSIFTDEPNLFTCGSGPAHCAVHLSPYIFSEFQTRHGYDLRNHLAELFFDFGDHEQVRFDYYDLLHTLWIANWAKPLETWCKDHQIALTGHYLEHDWPVPYVTPGHVHMLAHLDWPGIDLLLVSSLLGKDAPWFSLQKKNVAGVEPHLTLLIIQCASVARQLGKERVMCESWGAGGHDASLGDFRRLGEWLIVHGVNFLVPHHMMMTLRGSRKADHPQFFSDQTSWFLHTRGLNDHLARLCYWMRQGKNHSDFLVLDPLTTGYLKAGRSRSNPENFSDLCNGFSDFIQDLSERQFSFDLGDEYVMEEFGVVEKDAIHIGEQSYRTIILPGSMENLREATLKMLEAFVQGGGILVATGLASVKINGRADGRLARLQERHPDQFLIIKEGLLDYLADSFPASIQIIYPEEVRGLYHQRRLLEDGSVIHLLVNSGDKAFEAEITVHGIQAIHFDTIHGENRAFPNIRTDVSSSTFSHHFEAQDSLLFVATTSPVERAIMQAPALENSQASTAVPVVTNGELELLEIIPQSENRLVLDFCDLHMSGDTLRKNIPTWVAQDLIFKRHGFMRNPWHRAIQYRRQTMDRNTFGAESGFVAEYSFVWNEESPPARLQLAMECPDLFSIEFNGTPLPTDAFQPCELDPWIRSSEIAGLVCKGINRIRISAHPFDVRMELEPVFILGAFSARPDCIGFELGNPDSLRMGSWKSQGMPFYDRAMDYVMRMPALPPPTCDAWIEFDLVGRATLVEAIHGTRKIGEFGWAPGPIRIHAREFASDSRTLTFRVIGSPHNLFGAFHDPKKPEKIMGNFFSGSKKGPVSGDSYDIRDYGIFEPVRWSLVTGGAS